MVKKNITFVKEHTSIIPNNNNNPISSIGLGRITPLSPVSMSYIALQIVLNHEDGWHNYTMWITKG